MTKSKIFFLLSLGFIGGVGVRSFWTLNSFFSHIVFVSAVILLAVFWKNKKAMLVAFFLLAFLVGAGRASSAIKIVASIEATIEASMETGNREFNGRMVVAKEPEIKDDYQKVIAETSSGEKILINANKYLPLAYGDEIGVNCTLQIPENRDGEFDYRMYLAKDGIYRLCQKVKIEKTGNNRGNIFYVGLLKLKNKLQKNIRERIPQPEGALASGVLFGGSAELPQKLQNDFSRTGMTHIVAVSGYNVTIIAEYLVIAGIFLGFWRKQALVFAGVGIAFFVLMVGFPSSAVRAGVMGGLLLWAMKNGRLGNSENALLCAAVVMLFLNPLILRYDIGFQLSFLAALGIVVSGSFWERYFIKKYQALGFTELMLLTISAQIFVLPIIMYDFKTISLVSLLANAAVLPLVPLSMFLAFVTALGGIVLPSLAMPASWLTYLLLKYEVWIIEVFGNLNWASIEVKNFGVGAAVLWYAVLAGMVIFLKYHRIGRIKEQ